MRRMPIRSFPICIVICLCLAPLACQSQQRKVTGLKALKANLESSRARADYDALHFYLEEHYSDLNAKERASVRDVLKKHAIWSYEHVCAETEPGVPVLLSGRLVDENGKPVSGATVHIYQTNNEGYYSPTDATTGRMQEQDPRLEGFLTADSSGAFSFRTIHPASYPKKYEGRLIPAHIHVVAHAEGFRDLSIQMVFEDDPALTEYWVEWARGNEFPIVKLEKSEKTIHGTFDLKMLHL